jgi:hypothetical protein
MSRRFQGIRRDPGGAAPPELLMTPVTGSWRTLAWFSVARSLAQGLIHHGAVWGVDIVEES